MIACWEMAEIFLSQNMIYEWFGISFLFSEDRLANAVWFRLTSFVQLTYCYYRIEGLLVLTYH